MILTLALGLLIIDIANMLFSMINIINYFGSIDITNIMCMSIDILVDVEAASHRDAGGASVLRSTVNSWDRAWHPQQFFG